MYYLFEESDTLNTPVEAFYFDTANENFPVRPHWHYFAEMIYIIDGVAEMHSDETISVLSEGDLILFHPKSVHSIYPVNTNPLKYAVLKFDLNKINIASEYTPKIRSILKLATQKNMPFLFRSGEIANLDVQKVFTDCITELSSQKYGYDLLTRTKIYQLLMNVVRFWLDHGFTLERDIFTNETQNDIDTITEYIDQNIKNNLQVTDIANQCGLSYSCFARKFNLLYGMSCKEYIERMRMFLVEDYLLFTDFDLNYISQEVGFSDCSHMIKSFKKYRNCTPKQFRSSKTKS